MVFESILADVLNRVLGDYVENLDSNQLSVSIWGGDVVLQDLVLKQNALEHLDLPVQTVYGKLGKLVLKIPWSNLYGAPVEAEIENFFLVVVPKLEIIYNEEKEEKAAQELKQAELKKIEEAKKKEKEKKMKKKEDDTFVEKLTMQVIKNVQVKIRNIHIRYEDKVTHPSTPFAFGLTLGTLAVETTDEAWTPSLASDSTSKIFKVLTLEALAYYWNSSTSLHGSLPVDDLLEKLKDGIATKERTPKNYNYILGPINSSARLRMNPKPEYDDPQFSIPKVLLNLEMEKLAVGISKKQYQDIMMLAESMDRMKKGLPYRKFRPSVPYKNNAKVWWQFAYTCIVEDDIKRRQRNWDWGRMKQHREMCRDYAKYYKERVLNKRPSPEVLEKLAFYEEQLDLFNLIIIRQTIELEIEWEERESKQLAKQQSSKGWFSGWWGGSKTNTEEDKDSDHDIKQQFRNAMTPDEKKKLFQAIDYQENSSPAEFPIEYIATTCAFYLKSFEIEVVDEKCQVLFTELKNVNCKLKQRPAANALQAAIKIDQFTIHGVKQGKITPCFVSSNDISEGSPLLDVLFETNSLNSDSGQLLYVKSQPLKITYDAQTVIKLLDVFKMPPELAGQLQVVATSKLDNLKEVSATGMQYAIEKHTRLDLNINFSAPFILIPFGGLYTGNEQLLIINLGRVNIYSEVPADEKQIQEMIQSGTTEDDILENLIARSYDRFLAELTDVQILLVKENEDWMSYVDKDTISPMHLLQPMTLNVNIGKCLVCDDPRLPKMKIDGELPSINLNIDDEKALNLLSLLTSIPFPKNEEQEIPLKKTASVGSTLSMYIFEQQKKEILRKQIEEESITQTTDLTLTFAMKKFCVTISQREMDKASILQKLLQFNILNLEMDFTQQTYHTKVDLRLGGIGLTQFMTEKTYKVISTPMVDGNEEYLLSINYQQNNRRSPEFHTKYNSCEQSIQLFFSSLTVLLHQEGLTSLMILANDFQTKLDEATKKPDSDRVAFTSDKTILTTISEGISTTTTKSTKSTAVTFREPRHVKKQKKTVIETITFKLTAHLNEVFIILESNARKIAAFGLEHATANIVLKKTYTQIDFKLKDLLVIDSSKTTKHYKIISEIEDTDALDGQVVMYNTEAKDTNKVNMSVLLKMGRLRIIFLNSFVMAVLDFLNHFQTAQQALMEAAKEAAEVAKLNVQNVYKDETKISLKINMNAPTIIIPANSVSYDAIILDLGRLTISNRFFALEVEQEGMEAVIDDLNFKLVNLKLLRVLLDEQYNYKYESTILHPITFALWIKRNLSTSWYQDIPNIDVVGEMKAIVLNINQCDYLMIMRVLNENLAEGNVQQAKTNTDTPSVEVAIEEQQDFSATDVGEKGDTRTLLKYTFTMESLIINLFISNINELYTKKPHADANCLGKFTLHILSLKGRIFGDQSMVTSLLLIDCLLDDTRPERKDKLTRMMERKEDTEEEDTVVSATDVSKSMVDLTYQQKKGETFVDLRIFSFNLILSMDYLLRIANFFTNYETEEMKMQVQQSKPKTKVDSKSSKSSVQKQKKEPIFVLNLRIEKPDIILVESMDNLDVRAMILNTEMTISVKIAGDSQHIRGVVNDLQLYTCSYNPSKRKVTKCPVLNPCNITIMGTTPENYALSIEVILSEIKISVSPATVELLSRILAAFSATAEDEASRFEDIDDYSDLWEQKLFHDYQYWYLKMDSAKEVVAIEEIVEEVKKKELCVISAPSFILTVETGMGKETMPMLLLEIKVDARIYDWSTQMYVDSTLCMQMGYYNSRLALWEPLIEPVETITPDKRPIVSPWELKFELQQNKEMPLEVVMEELEEKVPPSKRVVTISSKTNLELVLTKTCLEVMNTLAKAFQNAVKEGVEIREESISPYKLVNNTGLQLTLLLVESDFDFFENDGTSLSEFNEVIVESEAEVPLQVSLDEQVKLKLGFSSYALSVADEKKLIVVVNKMKCKLKLPILKADKRFFSLNYKGENNDNWGIVLDVSVSGAQTIVTLRSMVQVHNCFNEPIDVYYMTNRGNEIESIRNIPPKSHTNLPLPSIYTLTNELFFCIEDHSVTTKAYIWKDLQQNLTDIKILTCPPLDPDGENFIIKACGEIEQIYFENTNKHTMVSTCYNIYLRPTITFRNYLPIEIICIVEGDHKEIVLPPGESVHMPTVDPGNSYIVLRLMNYLERDWYCKKPINAELDEFMVLEFTSVESAAPINLNLGLHSTNKKGTNLLSLYCPFWMLNKTGLMLSYRKSRKNDKNSVGSPSKNSDDNTNVMHHPADFKGPILFSFNAKHFFGKKKAAIRVENGPWSDKFSIDVAGSSGMVVCRANERIYQIGVHNVLTYNNLTKQITFTPYFVLINNAPYAIECQEEQRSADPWIKVDAQSCTPLWPICENDDKLIRVRVLDKPKQISVPIFITEQHTTLLKLHNSHGGVSVDVQITEGAIYITFNSYNPGLAPAFIVNYTNLEIRMWEKGTINIRILKPKHGLMYTWEHPIGSRLLVWEDGKKGEIEEDLRKDALGEIWINSVKVFYISFLDGMQRVLLFTTDPEMAKDAQTSGEFEQIDQEINVSIHGLGLSLVDNKNMIEILYVGIASTGIIWEITKMNSKRYKQLSLHECTLIENAYQNYLLMEADNPDLAISVIDSKIEVDFKNMAMLKPHKRRLRRSFQTGLWLQQKSSPSQLQFHAKINRIQIDNQMYNCMFPVVLAPVPLPKSVAANQAIKPFAELSLYQRVMKHSRVQQFKYFKVLIQEFHVKVDLTFINAVMEVLATEERTAKEDQLLFETDMKLVNEPLLSHVSTISLQEQKNFYDLLHLSPLKIHISFSMASQSQNTVTDSAMPEVVNVLLQGLGVTLTDMQDVIFKLAFFERQYSFLTRKQLINEAMSHYTEQLIKQLYVLVLGLDVIGNPYGLVLGLTKGVEDLFYEPFQGAIQGPGEFAEGLALGVRSLFGHTVGGAAGAVSKITGAVGKGVACLTFDKDYQRKRTDQINKKPANLQEGLARSGKGLVMGLYDGVTGVVTKPISGAKEQGVEGFFKGLGKGAVGLVTRPTSGVIDFASGSLDAVKRAVEMGNDVSRLRPPRHFHSDGLIRHYNKQEAEGNKLLMELEKGKYASTDTYDYHKWIIMGKDILLLTDKRLAYVVRNEIFGYWQVEWSYTWQEIQIPAKVVEKGVLVQSKDKKKWFGSGESGKLVLIPNETEREFVKNKIESLRNS